MERELLQLRAGAACLAELRHKLEPQLGSLATYWYRRYEGKQTLLECEDLVSMGEVAVWRAVDTWDPARRSIGDYVLCAVGRAMEKALKAAAGWPDPRRPAPALQVYFSDTKLAAGRDNSKYRDAEAQGAVEHAISIMRGHAPEPQQEVDLQRKESALESLGTITDGFGKVVAELVLRGYTIGGAGSRIFESPRLRRYYGLRDLAHAQRAAHAAAVRVRQELASGHHDEG